MKTTDKFVFFWGSVFSNWHTVPILLDGIMFNCVEQYMMYQKAMIFGDKVTAGMILGTLSPKEQKKLGRKVTNFNDKLWDLVKFKIVTRACLAKFMQNPELLTELLSHQGKTFVEASPYDKIWGVGLDKDDPDILDEAKWKGENLLGKAITNVRNVLEGLYE